MLIVSRYALQILQYALNTQILEQQVNIDICEGTPYEECDLKSFKYCEFGYKVMLHLFGRGMKTVVSNKTIIIERFRLN